MWTPFEAWKKYRVTDVSTIEEFMDRYYKPDRYKLSPAHKDYPNYAEILLASHKTALEQDGVDIISHHDSVTGRVVAFYKPENV